MCCCVEHHSDHDIGVTTTDDNNTDNETPTKRQQHNATFPWVRSKSPYGDAGQHNTTPTTTTTHVEARHEERRTAAVICIATAGNGSHLHCAEASPPEWNLPGSSPKAISKLSRIITNTTEQKEVCLCMLESCACCVREMCVVCDVVCQRVVVCVMCPCRQTVCTAEKHKQHTYIKKKRRQQITKQTVVEGSCFCTRNEFVEVCSIQTPLFSAISRGEKKKQVLSTQLKHVTTPNKPTKPQVHQHGLAL